MEIAVYGTTEMLTNQLRGLEIELESADQVDVQRVEICEKRLESQPVPLGNSPAEDLAASLVALVVEHDAIVRVGNLDRTSARGAAVQMRDEIPRRVRQVSAHLQNGNELPFRTECCVECAERVGDSAPLFDRRVARIATVNHVPDETAHYADAFLRRHPQPLALFKRS